MLGFVNNLVEQDNVKVLLVTNEDELINRLNLNNSNYFNIKEKTISDTIQFNLPIRDAINNIMNSFDFKFKKSYSIEELINEVEMVMETEKCYNLRSYIFASQKTEDILEKFNCDDEFRKKVFLSNVAFCLKRKKDDSIKWDSLDYLSTSLGTLKYPLYKFSYDYIIFQYLDLNAVNVQYDLFLKSINEKNITDAIRPLFDTIYSYYLKSENDVKEAVNLIDNRLSETDDIPYSEYGKLANYLVAIKYVMVE